MGFLRREYWSGLHVPPPGDLPDPGIKPSSLMSPALASRFLTTSATWEALKYIYIYMYGGKFIYMEKAMAPHSSTLAWKIPWMEEPGGLQSMGSRSQTRLSNFAFTFHSHALEKEMATHSSVLAWRIPGTGEPGGLPFMGSHRVGHD